VSIDTHARRIYTKEVELKEIPKQTTTTTRRRRRRRRKIPLKKEEEEDIDTHNTK
jgi:hypothetical protein